MESLFVLTLLVLVAEVSFVAADDGKDFLHSFFMSSTSCFAFTLSPFFSTASILWIL